MTLTELMVTLAMMSVLLVAVVRFVAGTRLSLGKQEMQGEMLVRSSRIGANMRASIGSARLLLADYGGSPDFSSYRNWVRAGIAAKAPNTAQPASFCLPPLVSNYRSAPLYSVTPSVQAIWGDELLYLASLKPLTLTVKYGTGLTDVAQVLSLDRVQFVYLYPALVPVRMGGQAQGLRLAEWRSQPYILYGSIKDFTNTGAAPRLSRTCDALAAAGYNWAFDLDNISSPSAAWYKVSASSVNPMIQPDGIGPSVAPEEEWGFMDDFDYVADFQPLPGVDRGQVARVGAGGEAVTRGRYLIAFNTNAASVSPAVKTSGLIFQGKSIDVPAHAQADRGGQSGFPGGFEVAVIGRPKAREVVLRHVLMAIGASDPQLPAGTRRASEATEFVEVKNDY
jgi:hypothetical protein